MANDWSVECRDILALLAERHNVIISGPTGTGKSRLLAEVALAFTHVPGTKKKGTGPVHDPKGPIPIPTSVISGNLMPSSKRQDRAVFRTVFHQSSKHRDFVSGIVPNVSGGSNQADFCVVHGHLLKSAAHALGADGAALLIIDEINRGPAVQIFGGSIVAIESDKRLADDGNPRMETQFFDTLNLKTGAITPFALPTHLYILAALNQADASVEPLDVAFLRRWEPYRLEPSEAVCLGYFGLEAKGTVPETPSSASDVFKASVEAWKKVNGRISLGRGVEYQVGHGVIMAIDSPKSVSLPESLVAVARVWNKVRTHVEEVFFGDLRGVAAVFNASNASAKNPFKLIETTFADDLRLVLEGPPRLNADNIYNFLIAVIAD